MPLFHPTKHLEYQKAALIFVTAFAVRAVFFLVFSPANPSWIYNIGINGWLEIAQNLASGDGYTTRHLLTYFEVDHLVPTAARSPLPVLVLSGLISIFGDRIWPLFIYSWVLSAATAVLLYVLSQKIFASKKSALLAAFIYVFYIPEMYISSGYAAASESLFTCLLIGYFLAILKNISDQKKRWACCAGLLLGLMFLCRPAVLFFPILFIIWALKKGRLRAIPSIVVFLTAFILCISPWAIRNQAVFQKPILTSTLGGYNLLRHHKMLEENKYSIYAWYQFGPIARKVVSESGHVLEDLNEVQLDRILSEKALGIIKAYPWRYLKLCAIRSIWIWYKVTGEEPLARAQNTLIYVLMFPGMLLAIYKRHPLSVFVWHILYFVLFHAMINVQFRFICPMMPYGIMIALYMVFALIDCMQKK